MITYEDILKVFFEEHKPTYRSKPQYQSAIWYLNELQKQAAQQAIATLENKYSVKIWTVLAPAKPWYDAEEYHQKYIEKQSRRLAGDRWF